MSGFAVGSVSWLSGGQGSHMPPQLVLILDLWVLLYSTLLNARHEVAATNGNRFFIFP